MERQREAERKELVGCKDGERQINERKGRENWEKEIFREKDRSGRREETFQDETALPPLHCLLSFSSPRPDWTSLVELIRYSQSPLSDAHLSSALCHGWNERLRSFVDHYPCHISTTPPPTLVVGINWEGNGGQGFDSCFSLYPPPVMRVFLR